MAMASSLVLEDSSAKLEHYRPLMLKDFLRDDRFQSCSPSPSFSRFNHQMFLSKSKVQQPRHPKSNKPSMILLRTRSRKAAATTISAVHKLINVVKFLPFAASMKSTLVLRKSSKKGTRSNERNNVYDNVSTSEVKVKVKDILRWKSFRDLAEERSKVMDSSASPDRFTSAATATSATTTTSCSRRSSWCDSDFASEDDNYLPSNSNKRGYTFEECDDEQLSPVSVLESTYRRDNEEYFSPCHRNHTMFAQKIEEEEEKERQVVNIITERAYTLLSHAIESASIDISDNDHNLLMDFFVLELSTNDDLSVNAEFDNEILRTVKSWINGECDESYNWELEGKREVYVQETEKGIQWKKFRQEEDEISRDLEIMLLNELIDEALTDVIS